MTFLEYNCFMNKYLLEIGVEELPYKFISSAISQLKEGFEDVLSVNNIEFSAIKTYSTPRRLAIIIEGLDDKQEDEEKPVKGPILSIAFDASGQLTQAGIGFAAKNGVEAGDLEQKDGYVWANVRHKGKSTFEIIQNSVEQVVLKIQGPHFMRWGELDTKFQRPIRWIVSLFNDEQLPVKIAQVDSGKYSRGHRFFSDSVEIKNPDSYETALFKAKVIVDEKKRRDLIIEKSNELAEQNGLKVTYDEDLLDEVVNLVEYPVPCMCQFNEQYLEIPDIVTITVMTKHQRYFPVYKNDKLTNNFITITNFLGDNFENIRKGNERVISARLEDGAFFYNEDIKKNLEERISDLKGVTFQKDMGTMFDKMSRITELSKVLAAQTGENIELIEKTARLCKADLTTKLVFEFPELQGFIGSEYARVSGFDEAVVLGVKEHYFPLGAASELASSIQGKIVGIIDKIDTICCVFSSGKRPSGTSDPLGIRRATLGTLKTVIGNLENGGFNVNLEQIIVRNVDLLPQKSENSQKLIEEIKEFFVQRLVIWLSDNYEHDVLTAAISNKNILANLKDFLTRLSFLAKFVKKSEYTRFHESANRVIRILKNDDCQRLPDEKLFTSPSENALWDCVKAIDIDKIICNESEIELIKMADLIHQFFEDVLVNDENENIRNNRIALLSQAKNKFEKIADFSKVVH